MSKFVAMVFDSESRAYEGLRALRELHAEGSITLYGAAVIENDGTGSVRLREAVDSGPVGTAVGALTGGLIGLLGGPLGGAVGAGVGGLIGNIGELFGLGVGTEFLARFADGLAPGKAAVVAEIEEDWVIPLDTRMKPLGGTVLRQWRADFEDEQIGREVRAAKAEIDGLRAELAENGVAARDAVTARLAEAEARLQVLSDRTRAAIGARQAEADARLEALDRQAAEAGSAAQARLEARLEELRADARRRSQKLGEALELARQALAP